MNLANAITLARFPLLFVIAILLYVPFPGSCSLAFLLYLLTGFSDWLDGYVARRWSMVSNFGKFMDALTDKILMLGLFMLFLTLHILPPAFLFAVLLVLGREFFVTGIRLVAASRNVVVAAERSGKVKTVVQMVSVGALICAQAIGRDLHAIPFHDIAAQAMHGFGLALFLIAVVCAVESGIRYTVKYRFLFQDIG
ncbi:MAG: CDP-diacylglycerol--glycerol-3-phosphate 3-phosphatidyltransferase [Puniceicoccales bacterium]|jgi:CDP-diacylglycerol--glycerol-3-phosphate 3-phosphatidyltransferase|nr:CDP-diacylglycerol--glycerol-3-phosphate 3-phosphatidyltransferase [Puniceicoccales bacterium]